MAIEVNIVDENTVEIPGAVRVKDNGNGRVVITLLTTPTNKWTDHSTGRIVPSNVHMALDTGSKRTYHDDAYDGLFSVNDNWDYDPHKYANGSKMSIAESVARATDRVYGETWMNYPMSRGNKKDLAKLVHKLIKKGHGRNEVYRLGGRAKNLKETGQFGREKLPRLFELVALQDRLINEPVLGG